MTNRPTQTLTYSTVKPSASLRADLTYSTLRSGMTASEARHYPDKTFNKTSDKLYGWAAFFDCVIQVFALLTFFA